jgi:predicted RNase H-like HicB family nuclease
MPTGTDQKENAGEYGSQKDKLHGTCVHSDQIDHRPHARLPVALAPTQVSGTVLGMAASIDFTISFEPPDEQDWIVARVLEVPRAMSQGRTREEARENALDALRTVLTPGEDFEGQVPDADREYLRFTAAA